MVVGAFLILILVSTEPVVSMDEMAVVEAVLEISSSDCEVEKSVDM